MNYCKKCAQEEGYLQGWNEIDEGYCDFCEQNIILPEDSPEVIGLPIVLETIKNIPQLPQVQYSLTSQLMELRAAAVKLGLYDASDFLGESLNK